MNLWDIVKTVGAGIISTVVPGGSVIVGAINAVLPDDKKLPDNATGSDAISAINNLPPEKQAALMEKKFDVDITQIKETHSTVRAMLDADAKNPHSTRPYIAKGSFLVVAFTSITTISIWSYGVIKGDDKLVTAVMNGWQFVLAVIGPLVTLLWAYFGVLKTERKNRLDAAGNKSQPSGITGLLSKLFSK